MMNTFRAFKERPLRLFTFETFDQSDEKTWPDQQKHNDKDKYKDKDNVKYSLILLAFETFDQSYEKTYCIQSSGFEMQYIDFIKSREVYIWP